MRSIMVKIEEVVDQAWLFNLLDKVANLSVEGVSPPCSGPVAKAIIMETLSAVHIKVIEKVNDPVIIDRG